MSSVRSKPAFLAGFHSEAVQRGMNAVCETGELRRRTRQYVEEPGREQRFVHARIRRRSGNPARNAG